VRQLVNKKKWQTKEFSVKENFIEIDEISEKNVKWVVIFKHVLYVGTLNI
jgi:hypothetical protein